MAVHGNYKMRLHCVKNRRTRNHKTAGYIMSAITGHKIAKSLLTK